MNWSWGRTTVLVVAGFAPVWLSSSARAQTAGLPQGSHRGWRGEPVAGSESFVVGGATIQVDFATGDLDLTRAELIAWVRRAAQAVTVYYGRFPVRRARVLIVPVVGEAGTIHGTTWGGMDGFPAMTRIRMGQHTTQKDLAEDWVMTHEFVHTALPDLPDDQHWMEEGLATYIEPIARAQAGQLPAAKVWGDMMRGMTNGEPDVGDRGLNETHTWGRTYWGGAMFCLVADVAIRRQTDNRKGLEDALRAIVEDGGTIDKDWPLSRALGVGDRATGTTVLSDLYAKWSEAPVQVDLQTMWRELGVREGRNGLEFDDKAPLAAIRRSITSPE
jgi:hypothetical protein